jgi:hypothetical protein
MFNLSDSEYLWKPLLEATAQTIMGAIGAYAIKQIAASFYRENTFDGPLDLWKRGIHHRNIDFEDRVAIDCLISPYTQLFPGDPFANAESWRSLYQFEGKISTKEFQAMEFYVAKDETLRIGSINGETLVGIYGRYGYIGDGLVGIISTTYLKKIIPHFFTKDFFGTRAVIYGTLEKCPSQHGFVARGIAEKAGIRISGKDYANLPYININRIKLFSKEKDRTCSLLGSPWAVTDLTENQYIVQYGQLDAPAELESCINHMKNKEAWDHIQVYFDDITTEVSDVSFKRVFL